ncbi:MAG: hypothetical protein Q8K63_06550 [Acidimicrobiales bacterium]|nr:hypothetical protein [Acidimicrobiales bacterium]
MGMDRRNRTRRAANKRQHNRANRAHRSNHSSTKTERHGWHEVAAFTPLSIPWVSASLSELNPLDRASDGTTCFSIEEGPAAGFVVFDTQGLLTELLLLDGPVDGLGHNETTFVEDFLLGRLALSDPQLPEMPAELSDLLPARHGQPRTSTSSLNYWGYTSHDLAADGSRSVLAVNSVGSPTLIVIDRQGHSNDGMWIGPMFKDAAEADPAWVSQFLDLVDRRLAAGDPVFADFSDFLGCCDDDVVA